LVTYSPYTYPQLRLNVFSGQVQTTVSQSRTTQSLISSRPSDNSPSYISLSIFASYDGPLEEGRFTITAYSQYDMLWNETISKALYSETVTSLVISGRIYHPIDGSAAGLWSTDKQEWWWKLQLPDFHDESPIPILYSTRETEAVKI
jgi:hypothetical protein